MAREAGSYPLLDAALTDFGSRIGDVRQSLYYCAANRGSRVARAINENVRATSYVHLAASMEVLVDATFGAVIDEITTGNWRLCDLRMSLISISKNDAFAALANVRGLKNWERRCDILEDINSDAPAALDSGRLPLDGRTIRPQHLESLWKVFGVPGPALPGLRHRLALSDLADARNDVAHGNFPISTIARRKPDGDLQDQVTRIEEIGIHLHTQAGDYLERQLFRR